MNHRRLVGIDLGIASAHTVRVLDGEGDHGGQAQGLADRESLAEVEAAALAGLPGGHEARGGDRADRPGVAADRGVLHRPWPPRCSGCSSQKAADLRRFLSRHTKSNGIDADTLARLPLFDPAGLRPLALPSAERAALDRRVRATDRLTRARR